MLSCLGLGYANAQYGKDMTLDSMFVLFKNNNAIVAVSLIEYHYFFDTKAVYNNEELKHSFLKVFDQNEIMEYHLKNRQKEFSQMTKEQIDQRITAECYSLKIKVDSVLKNKKLRGEFWQKIVKEQMEKYKKEYESKKLYPGTTLMGIFARVPYPEAYTIIKQYWLETNDKSVREILVQMNDSDAMESYNKYIEENLQIVQTNKFSDFTRILPLLRKTKTPYSVGKQIELLTYDYKIQMGSEGPPNILNCEVLKGLIRNIEQNFKNEIFPWQKESSCEEKLKKYLPEIKIAAKRLAKLYEEQEEYWMINMPFYNKEGK